MQLFDNSLCNIIRSTLYLDRSVCLEEMPNQKKKKINKQTE